MTKLEWRMSKHLPSLSMVGALGLRLPFVIRHSEFVISFIFGYGAS